MNAASDVELARLLGLPVHERVEVLERIARRALEKLGDTHAGAPCARRALDRVVAWLHDPAVDGLSLQQTLLDENEEGVFALVDPRRPQRSDGVLEFVGGVVSLAAWHAFRRAGDSVPEGYEEDEEVLLRWLLQRAP